MTSYDAIIIGSGQAGPSLARQLAGSGMKVAIAERDRFGGTCVNTGCTPTKTLVASAYAVHTARRGADFGFSTGVEVKVDMKRIKARKDYIVGLSSSGVERSLTTLENASVYRGHARFVSPREVEGGSYIGLEFGQMYRRFGSEVTVAEMEPRLVAREDEDVSQELAAFLTREGVDLRLNAKCISVSKQGDEIVMGLDCAEGAPEVRGSHLLLAVGRRPNTDDLRLDRAGVRQDARGYIEVDDELRTNVPGIWALGDCNGRGAFTHTSYN